jgi:hypothetical protein
LNYLNGERRLGRLATADADGLPQVVPVGIDPARQVRLED